MCAAATAGALALMPGVVSAQTTATTTNNLTIAPPATRSVTVSASSVNCTPALTFPNGTCSAPAEVVTNGAAASHITINGADAIPSDNGTHWTLTGPTGAAPNPGTDQFFEGTGSQYLTNTAAPDLRFSADGSATANQSTNETLAVKGPSSSTDASTSFSTTITWTAGP